MTRVEEFERWMTRLSPAELADFRDWFLRYDADAWDRQIERDVAAGKLSKLAEKARKDYAAGKSKPL